MKKISILLLAAMSCSFAFLSCGFENFQTPKEVKVKTDATYVFSVMSFDSEKEGSKLKVSDYFDLGKTLEESTSSDSEDESLKIYKYNSGSQYQQFLIHMPLKEIDFDFSESFKDLDIAKEVKTIDIDQSFTVPNIDDLNKPAQPLQLDNIMEVLNTAVHFTGKTEASATVHLLAAPFTSITYTSGYLIVEADDDVSGTMALYHNDDFITEADFDENNIASLPLENATLYSSNMTIRYTGTDTNVDFEANIESTSVIHTAEGVNLPSSFYSIPKTTVTFDVDLDDSLKEVIIEEGTIEITISNPSGWSPNVISNYEIDISDAITPTVHYVKPDPSNPDPTNGDLSGCELHKATMKAEADVSIDITGGKTIVFANPPMVQVVTHITKVTAEKEMPDDFKTDITEPQAVGKDVTDYVNSITWKNQGAGFIVKASNNLPNNEHNKMSLSLISTELGVTNSNVQYINPGQTDQVLNYLCGENVTTTMTEGKEIDITGHLGLTPGPHSTTSKKTIKVYDVAPGTTYNISLVVEPKFDWEKANVKMPENSNIKDKMNTSINKRELFETLGQEFADKMQISTMPLYLFATIPEDILGSGGFEGKIYSYYADENGTKVEGSTDIYLLGGSGATDYGPISSQVMPAFTKNENDEITNIFGEATLDFAPAMNSAPPTGTLYLDYDVKLSGTDNGGKDVTPEQIATLKAQGKSKITMDVVGILTMDFKLSDTINIDLMNIADKTDDDLLGRSEATDNEYLKVIKTASITIDELKLPITGDVALYVDMYKDGNSETKSIGNGESFTLEVNPDKLLKTYPLSPDMKLVLGKQGAPSNFGILRTMPIGGKIKLKIKTDGEIPVYPFSEQN